MSNSIGRLFVVTSFGESHGRCIGVVVDGCPAGLRITKSEIQIELDRRRPGQSKLTTSRLEKDQVEILSGIYNGRTTGAPICMLIRNEDKDSSSYERMRWTPRPGHADYTAFIKYGGYNDYRGGGRFSGRITAGYVMAGALAKKLLQSSLGIEILAHTTEIGGVQAKVNDIDKIKANIDLNPVRCADLKVAEKMVQMIETAVKLGDSIGGSVECIAVNVPPGIGDPIFENLEGSIAKALFSIPAVKTVSFGFGDSFSSAKGSEVNDPFRIVDGRVITSSNFSGGILGGISNGMPIRCRVVFKPPSSIGKEQKTVNMKTMEETTLKVEGRHDPCIVPRAVSVIESIFAVILVDHVLKAGMIKPVLEDS